MTMVKLRVDDYSKEVSGELSIKWIDPKARDMPYVRESIQATAVWRSDIGKRWIRNGLVAYAVLDATARKASGWGRNRMYSRRCWYVRTYDPYPGGGGPCEAVDPRSIQVNTPSSRMTKDQWDRTGEYSRFLKQN